MDPWSILGATVIVISPNSFIVFCNVYCFVRIIFKDKKNMFKHFFYDAINKFLSNCHDNFLRKNIEVESF